MSEVGIVLPTKKIAASTKSPRKLIIFSKPKVGKTAALAELEGALLVDLEKGSSFVDAMKVDVNSVSGIFKLGKAIKDAGKPYKYIVIDTITKLEDLVKPYALHLYKQSPMGKNFEGDDVLTLPNGAGYGYLRTAFFNVLEEIYTWSDRIILLGHLKQKSIEKAGKEVEAKDLDLTGKIKSITSADVDAIGLLYRQDANTNILSFKTTDDVICGARPEHLKNAEIVLSEVKDGKLTTNWNKVFID